MTKILGWMDRGKAVSSWSAIGTKHLESSAAEARDGMGGVSLFWILRLATLAQDDTGKTNIKAKTGKTKDSLAMTDAKTTARATARG
jgi:hypothetical protein